MRHITTNFLPAVALAGAALLTSCADGNDWGDGWTASSIGRYLNIAATTFQLPAGSSQGKVAVEAVTTPWRFSGMAPWLTVSPVEGNADATVTLSATANLSGEHLRTSVFTLASLTPDYPVSRTLSVTQVAATPYITLSRTTLAVPAASTQLSVGVDANVGWSLAADGAWLRATVSADSTLITISADEHTGSTTRTAVVSVTSAAGASTELIVTQAAASDPVVEGASLSYPSTGGAYQLTLESEVAWTTEASASWVEIAPSAGEAGTHTLTVTALPNGSLTERTAFVYVNIGGERRLSIPVEQEGLYLRLSASSLTFDASASAASLTLTSNTSWQVLDAPEWLSVEPASGSGGATLSVVPSDNWDTASRSGTLRIGQASTGLAANVAVTQSGRTFPNLIASIDFGVDGGTSDVDIATDGRWTATVSHEWLTVEPASGTGPATLTVTAAANLSDAARLGSVSVSVGSTTHTISVTQAGRYFTLEPTAFGEISSRGGSHSVHISTNETWKATSTSAWMQLSQREGTGDIDVTFTVPDNASALPRRDTTTFTPAYLQGIRVVTTQAARYLRISQSQLSFFARGGSAEPIAVSTDCRSYSVTTDATWLTIERSGDAFTVTAAENDTDADRSATVVVAATDLNDGEELRVELPVVQMLFSPGVYVQPFTADASWNIYASAAATLRITGFTADTSWNPYASAAATITLTAFGSEQKWY